MPTISVIVPVYNVEQYLCKCLDSILDQTFTDFELLLIDDGSPDKSGQICDEYAQKDSRIRVFHKENGGASSARNLGLDNALGEWITFVDSDDWLSEDFFNKMLYKAIEQNVDAIFCNCFFVYQNGDCIRNSIHKKNKIENGNKILNKLLIRRGVRYEIWGKIIKAKFVSCRFNENVKIGEDLLYLIELFYNYDLKTAIITDTLYYYRQVNTSMMNNNNLTIYNRKLLIEYLHFVELSPDVKKKNYKRHLIFIFKTILVIMRIDFFVNKTKSFLKKNSKKIKDIFSN
jgi:glycosyltransferase involved in cell wall biosynthesis